MQLAGLPVGSAGQLAWQHRNEQMGLHSLLLHISTDRYNKPLRHTSGIV